MGTKTSHEANRDQEPGGDPWAAFGYLVAGVGFYGGIGYGLSVWLNASYLLPVGILVGAAFGFYLVFNRYRYRGETGPAPTGSTVRSAPPAPAAPSSPTPIDHDPPETADPARDRSRPDRDDRGDST